MHSSRENACPSWGKIGLLWLILIPLVMAIFVLAQPLAPNDLWYHLRAGEWMVQHQSFPRVAMFTPSVPAGTPYFYQSWFAEILMYLTLKWSGLSGSQILRAICFTGAMAIFIASAERRAKVLLAAPGVDAFNEGARRVAFVGLFALFMCIPNVDLRPQTFSVPLFAVFCAFIFSWSRYNKRQLVFRASWMIALMIIWANTHGAFATGLILLLLFCIGETVHFWWGSSISGYLGNRLTPAQLRFAWITFIGTTVSACINPRGWGIYTYVYELTGNTIGEKYIQEWQPPTWSDASNAIFFCCGIAILAMLIFRVERYRHTTKKQDNPLNSSGSTFTKSTFGALGMRPGELLVLSAFFVMGLRNVRSIIWFALLFIIAGTALICRILLPKVQNKVAVISVSMQRMNLLLAVAICLLTVPFLPAFKFRLPWPQSYKNRFAPISAMRSSHEFNATPPMMLSHNTPIAAAAFLRKYPPKRLLWNDMVFGSYLVWALDVDRGPWADPRVELRPDAFWETYLQTSSAKNNPSITLLQRGFSDVLINKEMMGQNRLRENLQSSPNWKRRYEDNISILFTSQS